MSNAKPWAEVEFTDAPIDDIVSPAIDWAVGYMLGRSPQVLYMLAHGGRLAYSASSDILATAAHNKIIVLPDQNLFMAKSAAHIVHAGTPQMAVMRCMLKMRYGDMVQVPTDLLPMRIKAEPAPQMKFMEFLMPRLSTRVATPTKAQHQETKPQTKPVKTDAELLDELQQALMKYNPEE